MSEEMEKLRYPIGKFEFDGSYEEDEIARLIGVIEAGPAGLREAIRGLNDEQLELRYREEGWTLRQVVHHVADSHLNAYTRFRLTLTETTPVICLYEEAKWAELEDAQTAPPEVSLALLDAMTERWVILMRGLTPEQWSRNYFHPEDEKTYTLHYMLGLYAWHTRHHTAHITAARERLGI